MVHVACKGRLRGYETCWNKPTALQRLMPEDRSANAQPRNRLCGYRVLSNTIAKARMKREVNSGLT